MARTRSQMRLVQVLGGLALALMILGTTIGSVQALTMCQVCHANSYTRAYNGECKGKTGQQLFACLGNAYWRDCAKHCGPNSPEAPAFVTCAGFTPTGCENQALGICSNETLAQNCNESNPGHTCQDTQVLPQEGEVLPSHCYVTCTCR